MKKKTDHNHRKRRLKLPRPFNTPAIEPSSSQEMANINSSTTLSQHQQFLYDLWHSDETLIEIKTKWHAYYERLDDAAKHQVWQEFYAAVNQPTNDPKVIQARIDEITKQRLLRRPNTNTDKLIIGPPDEIIASDSVTNTEPSLNEVEPTKKRLLAKINQCAQKTKNSRHTRSLLFGVSVGLISLLIVTFTFFNERFIAPFIMPSKSVSNTPIILENQMVQGTDKSPKVIIPKINVEIPVVYDELSTEDKLLQKALERGVVHYGSTPLPGEKGNIVVFGHSSNNIFNQGKYKFAFVLLNKLSDGDVFYLTRDGITYAYRVYDKKIVRPTSVEVLGAVDRDNTATLITCDPPGTSLNRLVVVGEQISPDPTQNQAKAAATSTDQMKNPIIVPSNAPSLWDRLTNWL